MKTVLPYLIVILAGVIALVLWSPGSLEAQDATHGIPKHRCDFCHGLHKGKGAAFIKKRVVEDICRDCHSAVDVSGWKQKGPLKDISPIGPEERFKDRRKDFIDPRRLLPPPPFAEGKQLPPKARGPGR